MKKRTIETQNSMITNAKESKHDTKIEKQDSRGVIIAILEKELAKA